MKRSLPIESLSGVLEERHGLHFGQYKGLDVVRTDAEVVADKEGRFVARISTDSVDRDDEVLLPEGMDSTEYVRNPVVCVNHDYSQLPVGKAVNLQFSPHAVYAEIEWGTTQMAKDVAALVKDGILRALSVGFVALERVRAGQTGFEALVASRLAHLGEDAKRCTSIVTKWLLLENSVCTLGCNQDALMVAVGKGLVSPEGAKAFGLKAVEAKQADPAVEAKAEAKPAEQAVEEKPAEATPEAKAVEPPAEEKPVEPAAETPAEAKPVEKELPRPIIRPIVKVLKAPARRPGSVWE